MIFTLTILHVIVSLALIVIVLLQQGKQQGLSGAIAGGAETFFGKSKARTIDSMLKKLTTVVAVLFIANSIGLSFVIATDQPAIDPDVEVMEGDFDGMEGFDMEGLDWGDIDMDGIEFDPGEFEIDLENMDGFEVEPIENVDVDPVDGEEPPEE